MCKIYYDIAQEVKESILSDKAVEWYRKTYKNDGFPIITIKLGGKDHKPKAPDKWIPLESFEMLFGRRALEDYGVCILLNIYTRITNSRYPITYSHTSCFECITWFKKHSSIMRSIFPEEPNLKQGEDYGDIDDLEERINAAGIYITDSSLIDVMHI